MEHLLIQGMIRMIRRLKHRQIVGAERIANIVVPSGSPNPIKFHADLIPVQVAVEGKDDHFEITISTCL